MFPHLLLFDHIRSRNVDEDVRKGIERENNYDDNFISHNMRVSIKSYSHLF
jgi:hypothetical protein